MKKRFNLYYLLLEDQCRNLMGKESRERIRKALCQFFTKKNAAPTLPPGKEEQR